MKMLSKSALSAALIAVAAVCVQGRPDETKSDQKTHDDVTAKAVAFLKTRQAKDGSWSKANSYGITGVVLIGLFHSGKVKAEDEVAANGLKFVEGMIDSKEGHLAVFPEGTKGAHHKNYVTCVNLLALRASGQDR